MGFRIPWAKPFIGEKEKAYLLQALESSWISDGPFIEKLEEEFARLHCTSGGMPRALTTSSGTTALHLVFLALNIGAGDEVIVPNFTFAAPANMALAVGAKPIFADIDEKTWCMDPASVESLITPKTRAIVAVHLYGAVCPIEELSALAKRHGIFLIEDCAEAAFSKYGNDFVGTLGTMGCFNFHATKSITSGEGGMILTKDGALLDRMKLIRNHGMRPERRYWHEVVGHNFRLTNLQAAVAVAQLENLDAIMGRRRNCWQQYQDELQAVGSVTLQKIRAGTQPLIWMVGIRLHKRSRMKRDDLMTAFAKAGIETRPGFYPLAKMPIYQSTQHLSVSEEVAPEILTLPFYATLTTGEIQEICSILKNLT